MRLRVFTLLASSFLSVSAVYACGEEGRVNNCYMFSTYNRNEQTRYIEQNVSYWKRYTGNRFTDEQVLAQLNNSGSESTDANLLLNYLKGKGDKNGVEYLEKLKAVKKAAKLNENRWNYPTKEELAQNRKDWTEIYNFAANKLKGKRTPLSNRYVLMAMRGAFYSGKDDALGQIWLSNVKQVHEKDIAAQCQGYLASNWIKTGWTEKARDFYIKTGSLNDLRATFPQVITTKTIKDIFDKYPESKSFPYVVQDFLNSSFSNLNAAEKNSKRDSLTKIELVRFVKFSGTAATAGTTQSALWLSARAYAMYLLGADKKQVLKALQDAQKVKSTARVAYNTRCLRLICSAEVENIDAKFEAMLTKELTWLRNTAAKEKCYYDYVYYRFRNHYTDVMDHVVHDILVPRYIELQKPVAAAILANVANELNETQSAYNARCSLIKRDSTQKGFNGDYRTDVFRMLDTMSTESVINYYKVLTALGGTPFEQSLVPFCYSNNSYLCDIIATKLMREFQFKPAMEYLKKVDSKYVTEMNSLPYMAYSFTPEFWVYRNRQKVDPKLQKKPYTNKMNFCKQMLKLEDAVAKAQQKQKLDAKYAENSYLLAKAYIQASPKGACWALTNYSWSVTQDSAVVADNAYIKRAASLLRSAYSADTGEENMVRCLSGLFFLSYNYSPSSDQDKLAKLLWKLKDTPTGEARRINKCDVLKHYITGNGLLF